MRAVAHFGDVVACSFGFSPAEVFSAWPIAAPRLKQPNRSSNFKGFGSLTGTNTQTIGRIVSLQPIDVFRCVDVDPISTPSLRSKSSKFIRTTRVSTRHHNNSNNSPNTSNNSSISRTKWCRINPCRNSSPRKKSCSDSLIFDVKTTAYLDVFFTSHRINFNHFLL